MACWKHQSNYHERHINGCLIYCIHFRKYPNFWRKMCPISMTMFFFVVVVIWESILQCQWSKPIFYIYMRYAASSGCSNLKIYAILFFWRNANFIKNSFCSSIRNQMLFFSSDFNFATWMVGIFFFRNRIKWLIEVIFFHCYAYIISISAELSS